MNSNSHHRSHVRVHEQAWQSHRFPSGIRHPTVREAPHHREEGGGGDQTGGYGEGLIRLLLHHFLRQELDVLVRPKEKERANKMIKNKVSEFRARIDAFTFPRRVATTSGK